VNTSQRYWKPAANTIFSRPSLPWRRAATGATPTIDWTIWQRISNIAWTKDSHWGYMDLTKAPSKTPASSASPPCWRKHSVEPSGVRQHWLRFAQHERFFEAVADAGLTYDSTLGFAETAGFRNGRASHFLPTISKTSEPIRFSRFHWH
jgi:hypothetical protein